MPLRGGKKWCENLGENEGQFLTATIVSFGWLLKGNRVMLV